MWQLSFVEDLSGYTAPLKSCRLMQNYVGQSMALHTRYPGHNGHQPQMSSPLGRVVDIINQVPPAQPHCLQISQYAKCHAGWLTCTSV